jgi:hypothetical protein
MQLGGVAKVPAGRLPIVHVLPLQTPRWQKFCGCGHSLSKLHCTQWPLPSHTEPPF